MIEPVDADPAVMYMPVDVEPVGATSTIDCPGKLVLLLNADEVFKGTDKVAFKDPLCPVIEKKP